jgi:hypothetical protein
MMPWLPKQSLAVVLVLCLLVIGGLGSAQAISHESHHAHHQKSTHATVLCAWMCAAGQVLDAVAAPDLIERSPVSRVEFSTPPDFSSSFSSLLSSRGPPADPTI